MCCCPCPCTSSPLLHLQLLLLQLLLQLLLLPRAVSGQPAWVGNVTTLAGNAATAPDPGNRGHADGAGAAASFYQPFGIAMDSAGTIALVVR